MRADFFCWLFGLPFHRPDGINDFATLGFILLLDLLVLYWLVLDPLSELTPARVRARGPRKPVIFEI